MATKAKKTFSAEEKEAMKARADELKKKSSKADDEKEVLAKIADMPKADRELAEKIHEIVKATAPELSPKTWYGMPAYAKDGKVICFFTNASKFKERYATLGFSGGAQLDDGHMWPTSFALTTITPTEEKKIAALVRKAVG